MGHALSLGGRDGRQRCGRPRGRPGGHLVGRASASSTQASRTEGGGHGTERTHLQDWVLVNRKGIFTEDALLLLPERLLADVSAAGAAPCSSPGMKTGRCLDTTSQMYLCPQSERGLPAQMRPLAWTLPEAPACPHGLDSWTATRGTGWE